jgi:hypothetical protein
MGKNYTLFDIEPEESRYALVCNLCGAVVHSTKLHNAFHESLQLNSTEVK